MSKHVDEYYVFEDFRDLDNGAKFIGLFNEHSSMDRTFQTKMELGNYIDNDYSKLKDKEQEQFIRDMERAMTDLRANGFFEQIVKEEEGKEE